MGPCGPFGPQFRWRGALKRQCGSCFCNDLQATRQCVSLKRADKSNPLELSTPLKIDLQELPLKDD